MEFRLQLAMANDITTYIFIFIPRYVCMYIYPTTYNILKTTATAIVQMIKKSHIYMYLCYVQFRVLNRLPIYSGSLSNDFHFSYLTGRHIRITLHLVQPTHVYTVYILWIWTIGIQTHTLFVDPPFFEIVPAII